MRLAAAAAGLIAAGCLVSVPRASATEQLYWTNYATSTISHANADGSGDGGELNTTGAAVVMPAGIAIDPSMDRIFWANSGENSISYANLDGTGGGQLTTGAAMVNAPVGLTVDTTTDRVYWVNNGTNTIAYANADGSGDGGELNTTGATITDPDGLALDTAAGRVYWANGSPSSIGYADLDGSGGGTLDTSGATPDEAWGIVVNQGDGRVYYTMGSTITYARTDIAGLGGTLLHTFVNPFGMAVDPFAGEVFWTDGHGINVAGMDGSGAATVSTMGASQGLPMFLVVVAAPIAAGPPAITGGSTVGTPLSCSRGAWAADEPGDFFYRSPFTYDYRWTLNGATLPGQTAEALTPASAGSYACVVTGTNPAGSATQDSAPVTVSPAVNPGGPAVGVNPVVPVGRTTTQAPTLTQVAETHRTWRERSTRATAAARRHVPTGTSFSFTVDQLARVRLTFWQTIASRLVGGPCRTRTRESHRHRRCRHVLGRGALSFSVAPGRRSVSFDGRVRGRRLPPGTYTVELTATSETTALRSAVWRLGFRILS